jgi:hypothetical protein
MATTDTNKEQSLLKLLRFCGEELYPINKATWHIYKNEEDNINELWLDIEVGVGIALHEDTEYIKAKPHWELTYKDENLDENNLQVGFKAEIPSGYDEEVDDNVTNFYYCEHEPTDNNTIEILAVDKNKLLIRVTGECTDVNFYDGSKPNNRLFVETWFEHNE